MERHRKATIVRDHATIYIPKDLIATFGAGGRLSSRFYGRGSCEPPGACSLVFFPPPSSRNLPYLFFSATPIHPSD